MKYIHTPTSKSQTRCELHNFITFCDGTCFQVWWPQRQEENFSAQLLTRTKWENGWFNLGLCGIFMWNDFTVSVLLFLSFSNVQIEFSFVLVEICLFRRRECLFWNETLSFRSHWWALFDKQHLVWFLFMFNESRQLDLEVCKISLNIEIRIYVLKIIYIFFTNSSKMFVLDIDHSEYKLYFKIYLQIMITKNLNVFIISIAFQNLFWNE